MEYTESELEKIAENLCKTYNIQHPLARENIVEAMSLMRANIFLHKAPFDFTFNKMQDNGIAIHVEDDDTDAGFAENIFDVITFVIVKYGYGTEDDNEWKNLDCEYHCLNDIKTTNKEKIYMAYLKYAIMLPLNQFEITAKANTVWGENNEVLEINNEKIAKELKVDEWHVKMRIENFERFKTICEI